MKIILNKRILKKIINKENNLGFVPTMGSIHKGHISLVKRSMSQCKKTLVSIFINRPQFNKRSDFIKYPRSLKKDINQLNQVKIDYLYLPTNKQIYNNKLNRNIKINKLEKILCGKFRPGHFRAVVDVIDRFIKIIKPKRIFLGEKDMQQLKIIEAHIKKNRIKTKVIKCKTIREKNGIPYSSRNFLLTKSEKSIASQIYQLILREKKKIINNTKKINHIKKQIYKLGVNKIDYVESINVNKLVRPYMKKNKYKIFIAYYLKTTRLIDNI